MRQHNGMTEPPDFRTARSESVEGAGNAAARWYAYHGALDEDVLAEAFQMRAAGPEDYPEVVRDDVAETYPVFAERLQSGARL